MNFPRILSSALLASAMALPSLAHAWWNGDFTHRTKDVLNTSAQGVETKEALSGVVVPVRLHSGNFDFLGAKPDGADLRVIAADDKTPLKHWVERFDGVNELAVVWVQLPNTLPGTDKNIVYVYAGNEAATAEAPKPALSYGAIAAAVPSPCPRRRGESTSKPPRFSRGPQRRPVRWRDGRRLPLLWPEQRAGGRCHQHHPVRHTAGP